MATNIHDRIRQTSTSTGTGTFYLDGTVAGYLPFTDRMALGDSTYYTITDGTAWEVGIGSISSIGGLGYDSDLSRDKVIASSNSDALVSFSAGTKDVFVTAPARRITGRGLSFALASGRYNS